MAKNKNWSEVVVKIKFNPTEVDEDTIVSEIEECLEMGFGQEVAFVKDGKADPSYHSDEDEEDTTSETASIEDEEYD